MSSRVASSWAAKNEMYNIYMLVRDKNINETVEQNFGLTKSDPDVVIHGSIRPK